MFSKVTTFGLSGLNSFEVKVECSIAQGSPDFKISGLGDVSIQESKQRVQAALRNSGFATASEKITVNLSPADIRKSGSSYDFPVLVSVLLAKSSELKIEDTDAFIGEVSLSGELVGTKGILPMTAAARKNGIKRIFIPSVNVKEASLVRGIEIFGINDVVQLISFLEGKTRLLPTPPYQPSEEDYLNAADFSDVRGQESIKFAIQTAAAGFHNLLMIGPPGSGKSMLAKRIPGVLPKMTFEESIESTSIYSVAGLLDDNSPFITNRPFRPVNHTASSVGIIGGGKTPAPGEISLAHNGVLFLDELPEFRRDVLEILRQPLEDKKVYISRAAGKTSYPCKTMLVAAMNPCPCGNYGSGNTCTCSELAVNKYLGKISRPILDRIDIQVEVNAVTYEQLRHDSAGISTAQMRETIEKAREKQKERFKGTNLLFNSEIPPSKLHEYCEMEKEAETFLSTAFDKLGLSARAYDRILKVARTAADMDGKPHIEKNHIATAVRFRTLDKKYWK